METKFEQAMCKFKSMTKDTNGRIILMITIGLFITFVGVSLPIEVKTQSLHREQEEMKLQMEGYTELLNRYKVIKETVENNYYTDSEKQEIERLLVEIESLMTLDTMQDLENRITSLENRINEMNTPILTSARSGYNEILGMELSWLTDSEKEKFELEKNNVKEAFNSDDEARIETSIQKLTTLKEEFYSLVDARKNDSRSLEVTEPSYINGVLIVNKHFALPKDYNYGEDKEARNALDIMIRDARKEGINLRELSGFRSYSTQNNIYLKNVSEKGEDNANMYSARAGESEHQAGVAFDLGGTNSRTDLEETFGSTTEGLWLAENCHKYGFILRYMKGKEDITGYAYEPWHFRYVGVEHSTKIKEQGVTLEEYLGLFPY